jgi:hypothetical protein
VALSDTILKGTHTGTIYARFGPYLPYLAPFGQAVSEEKIFFNISQSEKRINLGCLCKVLYKVSPFRSTNKYGRQGKLLLLIGYCLKKSSPLKLLGKMEPILAGSIQVMTIPHMALWAR